MLHGTRVQIAETLHERETSSDRRACLRAKIKRLIRRLNSFQNRIKTSLNFNVSGFCSVFR